MHSSSTTGVPRLSRELIVDLAVAVADADGVAAVSMGRLGRELGVTTMGLYRHIESKQALLAAMAERVLLDLDLSWANEREPADDWQFVVRQVVYAWADLVERHPGSVRLIYTERPVTRMDMMPAELVVSAALAAGFTPPAAAFAYRTIVLFVDSVLLGTTLRGEAGHGSWGSLPAELLDQLPAVRRAAPYADSLTYREIFDYGVDLLIAGIADGDPRGR